jgi:hypothetical protein
MVQSRRGNQRLEPGDWDDPLLRDVISPEQIWRRWATKGEDDPDPSSAPAGVPRRWASITHSSCERLA